MWGEVDIPTVVGDKDVVVSATGFDGQLTGEVRRRGIVARNSTDEGGGSLRRWGQGSPRVKGWKNEERRVQARDGWRGGVLEERRFCRTTSKWPRAMKSDWGGFRRRSLVVRPRMEIYPRRIALRRVELEGEPRERET